MLASDLAFALDPSRLMAAGGMEPDPIQAALLRSDRKRILLNCTRQWGKSTTTAALALWEALYHAPALVLLLAPSHRQSKELFRKCKTLYRALGRPAPAEVENTLELELTNGSRVVCLPGKEETIRGFSGARALVIDEASKVPDALYYSVRPMLATSGGRLLGLSSPFGKRGWWYEAWEFGGGAWERFQVTGEECPRIPPEFLAEEREAMPDQWYRQEYCCEFVEPVDQWFRTEHVMGALSDEVTPLLLEVV